MLGSFASVHRGISTGANSFFLLTESDAQRNHISSEFLKPILPPRVSQESGTYTHADWEKHKILGKPCWLLSISRMSSFDQLPPYLKKYVKIGDANQISMTPTSKSRKPWYSVPLSSPPDFVFTYISRNPQFIFN